MWCRTCQQDVPAIGATDESPVCCARCRNPFSVDAATPAADPVVANELARDEPALPTDWLAKALHEDWELEDELNQAQQLAASLGVRERGDSTIRFDQTHRPPQAENLASASSSSPRQRRHKPVQTSFFSFCMLSVGLMSFVFGAVLVGWSFVEDRPDLWRLGLPFTLGGQAALIIGLIFQLDGLWRSNHGAAETLEDLDSQLAELRRATSLLSTTNSSPAQSFYSHMADGASPQLLLADLKGQLDLLASRMADDR